MYIYSKERKVRKGKAEQHRQNSTGRTLQAEQDGAEHGRQNRTDRTGQAEQERQNGTGRTGKEERDR
jgi:hypothetical protein